MSCAQRSETFRVEREAPYSDRFIVPDWAISDQP